MTDKLKTYDTPEVAVYHFSPKQVICGSAGLEDGTVIDLVFDED